MSGGVPCFVFADLYVGKTGSAEVIDGAVQPKGRGTLFEYQVNCHVNYHNVNGSFTGRSLSVDYQLSHKNQKKLPSGGGVKFVVRRARGHKIIVGLVVMLVTEKTYACYHSCSCCWYFFSYIPMLSFFCAKSKVVYIALTVQAFPVRYPDPV